MILPVYPDETWQENAERVAEILSVNASNGEIGGMNNAAVDLVGK